MKINVTPREYLMNVLNGTAQAIVIALTPNAMLSVILGLFPNSTFAQEFLTITVVFQFFTALMVGFLIAQKFNLTPMQQITVGGASMIGSGAWKFIDANIAGEQMKIFRLAGIGDLINIMLTAAIAVAVVLTIGQKFGSLNLILLPIVVGAGVGYIGLKTLPYVSYITTVIGYGINSFTNLQPFLMCLLLSMVFSLIIVSPLSAVAISLAIGLNGIGAGAAGMGIATCGFFLTIATAKNKNNHKGIPLTIFIGAIKMMMPNFIANPVMAIPIAISAAITSIPVSIFNIVGTPEGAGFGLAGLVGPITSLNSPTMNVGLMLITWFVIPIIVTYIVYYIFDKNIHLYDEDIFTVKAA